MSLPKVTEEVSRQCLLSFSALLFRGLGPQQITCIVLKSQLASAWSAPPPYGTVSRSVDLTPVGTQPLNLNC